MTNFGNCLYNFYSIDATNAKERLGRYVNDSSQPNAKMAKVVKDEYIYLYLYAIKDILPGTEIRYNYDAPKLWWRREVFARYAGHSVNRVR